MTILNALREGIGLANRYWKALLLVYLVNLALALTAAVPVFKAVDADLVHTESAARMAESFDWLWHQEFEAGRDPDVDPAASIRPDQQGALPLLGHFERLVTGRLRLGLPAWLQVYAFFYLVIMVLMTGGILGLFWEPGARFSMRLFLDRAGRYFAGLFAILIVAQVLYLVVWGLLGGALLGLVGDLGAGAHTEWTPVVAYWGVSALLMVLAFGIHMVMDYARVASVAWERLGLFAAVVGAIGFCRKRLTPTLALFYLVTGLGVILVALFAFLGRLVGDSGTTGLILTGVLQQVMVVALIWLRMVYLGVASAYYRGVMNMPSWAIPAGPPPAGLDDEVLIEEPALVD